VTVPFRLALGAGLGMAEADPMSRVVTVARELNPIPVTVTVSSTDASAGEIVIVGLGVENKVELPVIAPTVVDMIWVPGVKDPPVVAAGTSTSCVYEPLISVMIPDVGIALAAPIVNADAVVSGGKPVPVIVTMLPVDALRGVTETAPFGIDMLTCLLLLVVGTLAPFRPELA
jgi:hypothetical protein